MVSTGTTLDTSQVRRILEGVPDPEIPFLTIADLGILRGVEVDSGRVVVTITPTYSGCPAMDTIRDSIRQELQAAGADGVEIRTVYSPAWTTEWMSEEARRKLEEGGIAPPVAPEQVICPRCRGPQPRMVSEFGSTACKALLVCSRCGEPFHYFKQI